MKIGSPKNLEGKSLLVGVSAVDSNGNAIGSDITTLKNGANVTFTSSANGVLVIDARSVTSVENATSAVYAINDKNGNDIATTYQTVISDGNKLNGAYVYGLVPDKRKVNGMALSDDVTLTGADIKVNGSVNATTIDSKISQLATSVENVVQECQTLRNQTEAIYESVKATVATYYVGPAYNYGVTVDGTMLSFTWTDPADNDVVKWARTRLVMKTGGFPANENDGTALIDVTERNQHKTVPFTWDAGVISGYYFALFTQSTGGVWNIGDDCPRFTTDELTWATIVMMSHAGTLLQYPGMKIGSVVDKKVKDLYPKLRYRLADIDYSGSFTKVSDFMYDNTRTHNSIWIPYFLPSLGEGNSTASMMQFDAPESSYGATWDEVFVSGKAYYTVSGESYTQLTAGTDYQDGENIAEWQTLHGDTVYTKNHADRARYGNNIWNESNMRQWLNSSGNDWFQKQNEYDIKSKNPEYASGWMTDFVPGFLELVMPVYNKTARNTVSAIKGGGGGGYDITLDRFWLLSLKEFNGNNVNGIAEGQQLAYFRDVATTNEQRIQYDDGGVARHVWLRSPYASHASYEYAITTSGASSYNHAAYLEFAFQPVMCL